MPRVAATEEGGSIQFVAVVHAPQEVLDPPFIALVDDLLDLFVHGEGIIEAEDGRLFEGVQGQRGEAATVPRGIGEAIWRVCDVGRAADWTPNLRHAGHLEREAHVA